MANEDAAAARRYRQHAREVRAISVEIQDTSIRCTLLSIARDYEDMALSQLRIGKLIRHTEEYCRSQANLCR